MNRTDGRAADQLRPVLIERHVNMHAEGSVMIHCGRTQVLCTASIEERVPPWLRGKKQGWVTAEYGMLPRATGSRNQREASRGKQGGRTLEIQRLIGRSLRSVVDLEALGERTVTLDCDVIQADGGTRTASITGAWVALVDALAALRRNKNIKPEILHGQVAAVSVGVVAGGVLLDLDYSEDSTAETDMNLVKNAAGGYIEVQGTAEGHAFRDHELQQMLVVADSGIKRLLEAQIQALNSNSVAPGKSA